MLHHDEFREILRRMGDGGAFGFTGRPGESDMIEAWKSWADNFPLNCAKFEISGLSLYDDNVIDFGIQMAAHKALPMPWDTFYFEWTHDITIADDPSEQTSVGDIVSQTTGMFVAVERHDETMMVVRMLRAMKGGHGAGVGWPVGIDLYSSESAELLNNASSYKKDRRSYIEELLAFLALVSMKDIQKTTHTAPERRQIKRQNRGLPPLPDYVTLHLSRSIVSDAMAEYGMRNSPRPHFRRGHIRIMNRGTDDQKIVPVAPTWVKADGGVARMPLYKVKP